MSDERYTLIGVDGLTPYQRWEKHDAPFKAQCPDGLCVSYKNVIDCKGCKEGK
jgi:hypothetical protein